ncbi:MAG: hypothetical protein FJX80_08870 [Bacteroidetes bacterium]|nr:hypothetical protein [Bacteroidota bacterium]
MNISKTSSPVLNPLNRQPPTISLSLSLSDSSFSDSSISTTNDDNTFKCSSDSLTSFEDYRINNAHTTDSQSTYIYVKCSIPTTRDTCTSDFIKTMCCNCGRG